MNDLTGKIEQLASECLKREDLFLVGIHIGGSPAQRKVIVWVDGDKGVSIDDCAEISRMLGARIEEEGIIDSAYLLEVSSPGIDQPLKLKRQYIKNKGRMLSVTLHDLQVKKGKLEEVKENSIILLEEKSGKEKQNKKTVIEPVEISFTDIKKSNVLIAFNG
jgi:ribosome maturation factor RimP